VEVIAIQTQVLEKQREAMTKAMEEEQIDFEDGLENLEQTIGGFNIYADLNKYEEYSENVENVNQRLKECIDQSRLFNQREFLVNKETTDYNIVSQLAKEFKPYSDLWLTTRSWFINHQQWMNSPWEELDAIKLEADFEHAQKTISSCVRFFRDKGFPQILKIAETMKAKIEEFKPFVPLAVALRKDGMKDRHWDQVSSHIGFDLRPDEDFTLTTVIDKGMLKYLEICEEVGEKASKEFYIEKNLDKMMKDWDGLNFMLP